MGSFSLAQWVIALLIVLLVLGVRKLRNMSSDLGGALRGFKDSTREGGEKPREP